jgi:DNA-binding IclR family transcriptional regulator
MLVRGVEILQAFRPAGGALSLSTLVQRTGLPKATVFRLVTILTELGLLEHEAGRGYGPAIGLFELGELVPAKRGLRETALPYMQDLYEATHQTVHLGVRDDLDVVYAEKIRGHRGVEVPSRVGGRLPLSCTGVGKALLAYSPPDVIDAVLGRPLRRLTDYSITDPAVLAAELTQARRTGVTYEIEEAALGVACVATPVIVDGTAVAALSVTCRAADIEKAGLASAVRAVGLAISRLMGSPARASGPAVHEIESRIKT